MVAISIVSHGHGKMVSALTSQLLECPEVSRIIITKNIPEVLLLPLSSKIQVITNVSPKGFGENHNFVFSRIRDEYFCPLNPDIRLLANPFPQLIECIKKCNADLVAPIVLNKNGDIEDSVRKFPTLQSLLKKILFKNQERCHYKKNDRIFSSDWVAGMFMFFRGDSFEKLNGFDEKYFLYYEDVDICARLWKFGMRLVVDPSIHVEHDARRASRVNLYHMKLHIQSMGIYFSRYLMRLPKIKHHTIND